MRSTYRVGIGDLRVDLRNVHWSPGVHDVRVRVGIGEATVFVGPNVTVTVTGHAGIGSVRLFDRNDTGGIPTDRQATDGSDRRRARRSCTSTGGSASATCT